MHYTAWIGLSGESTLRGCIISDISDTGARLSVEHPEALPEIFHLLLSNRGGVHRRCRVMWRSKSQIGVCFDKSDASATQPEPSSRTAQPVDA